MFYQMYYNAVLLLYMINTFCKNKNVQKSLAKPKFREKNNKAMCF